MSAPLKGKLRVISVQWCVVMYHHKNSIEKVLYIGDFPLKATMAEIVPCESEAQANKFKTDWDAIDKGIDEGNKH